MKSFLCLYRVGIFVSTTLRQTKMHTSKCGSMIRYSIKLNSKRFDVFTYDKCRLFSRTCSWHINFQFSLSSAIIWKAECSYMSEPQHPETVLDELCIAENSETIVKMVWKVITIFFRFVKLLLIFLPIMLLSPLLYLGHRCRKFWFLVMLIGNRPCQIKICIPLHIFLVKRK